MVFFEHIAIVGVGLLGGAIARGARHHRLAGRITGFGRSERNLKEARDAGVIDDWNTDPAAAVSGADLLILCSPVGSIGPRFAEMAPHLKPGCRVTDAGSVKGVLVRDIESRLPEGVHFVGAHPIAGGEKTGWQASSHELLEGARCILTPTGRTDAEALRDVRGFWQGLGMEVLEMDADEHDLALAAVSHLPHVVAYALMNTVGATRTPNFSEVLSLGAGGLRDITRIASADPVLWRDICAGNRKYVLQLIGDYERELGEIRSMIEQGREGELEQAFARAREYRGRLGDARS